MRIHAIDIEAPNRGGVGNTGVGMQFQAIVEYTIHPQGCPVSSWLAIRTLSLPHIGAQSTGRTSFVRARIDIDGSVESVWDWVDKQWVPASEVVQIHRAGRLTH